MKKLLVKFYIVFGLFFVGLSIVTAEEINEVRRCTESGDYKSEAKKFEGGVLNSKWYDNRITSHSSEDQDRMNAIADDVVFFVTGVDNINLTDCESIKVIQRFLANEDGYTNPSKKKGEKIYNGEIDAKIGKKTLTAMREYCHIVLNTRMPFLGRCISKAKSGSVFTTLIGHLIEIVLTLFFVGATIAFIVAGVLMASAGGNQARFDNGKQLAVKTIFGVLVLGLLALLLHLINPNFFM